MGKPSGIATATTGGRYFSDKRIELQRAVTASISTNKAGSTVLEIGFDTSRRLWNYVWWLTYGYNEKLRKQRGDSWETYKRLKPKGKDAYPGNFDIQKELKDHWAFANLADRCASYTVKDFDIAQKSFWSNLKSNPDAKPPRPVKQGRTLTFEVGRNAKPLGNWQYKLTVLGGHIKDRHAVVQVHVRPGVKMADVHMLRVTSTLKKGRYQVSLLTKKEAQAITGDKLAALDLGIVNMGVLAIQQHQSVLYSGKHLLDVQRFGDKRGAACKPSGYTGKEARLPMSQRNKDYLKVASNTTALGVHNFTTDVIRECVAAGVSTLAVGALTGIRENKNFGDSGNQKFHRWWQGKAREQLKWKGQEYGIDVVEISEAYTSQTCNCCGIINKGNRVTRGLYKCSNCGLVFNADENGALNMLKRIQDIAVGAKTAKGVEGDLSTLPSLVPERKQGKESAKSSAETRKLRVKCFDLRSMALVERQDSTRADRIATTRKGAVCEMHV